GPPDGGTSEPVQAGVDDDPVEPGGHGGIPAVGAGPPERVDQAVLKGVRRLFGIAERTQGNGPQPVTVALDQLTERVRVPAHVPPKQRLATYDVLILDRIRRQPSTSRSVDRDRGDLGRYLLVVDDANQPPVVLALPASLYPG